jgi:hypothetical protein
MQTLINIQNTQNKYKSINMNIFYLRKTLVKECINKLICLKLN